MGNQLDHRMSPILVDPGKFILSLTNEVALKTRDPNLTSEILTELLEPIGLALIESTAVDDRPKDLKAFLDSLLNYLQKEIENRGSL